MSSELTDFLTLRRGQIAPISVGLNRSKTRRTKGLTREDMAELTGVSFKWYTLFESGASKGVSRKLAQRVAAVLALSPEETHYLMGLLGFADSFASVTPDAETGALTRLMHSMESVAAAMYSPVLDVLDCNRRYAALFPPPVSQARFGSNRLWRLFFDQAYRAAWVDWPAVALHTVADFKAITAYVRHSLDYTALLGELGRSEEFKKVWNSEESFPAANAPSRFTLMAQSGECVDIESLVLRSLTAPGVHLRTLTIVDPSR